MMYAVVDLETTGSSPQLDKLIQIGIVFIEHGVVVDSFSQDINPEQKLSAHIAKLTQITDAQLLRAPLFEEVAELIYTLLKDKIFIAHNINFDYQFLKYQFAQQGFDFDVKGIDTVELTQILYPTLDSYRLEDIARTFQLQLLQAHQAENDALATAELFIHLNQRADELPKQLLGQLFELSRGLSYQTGTFFGAAFARSKESAHLFTEVNGLLLKKIAKPATPLATDEVELSETLSRFGMEKRPVQAQLIDYLANDSNQTTFIEAPSGIGKTFAYLFSGVKKLKRGQRLVVATETKLLQAQLMNEELPKIEQTFQLQATLLKSRRNYLNLTALKKNFEQMTGKRGSIYQMGVLVWLLETETGDLDELNNLDLSHAFFEDVRYTTTNSFNQFGAYDFYERIKARLADSSVLVINHAYLLECLESGNLDFTDDLLVIDEAHAWLMAIAHCQERTLDLTTLFKQIEQEAFDKDNELQLRITDYLASYFRTLSVQDLLYFDEQWFEDNQQFVEAFVVYLNDLLTVGTEYHADIEQLKAFFEDRDSQSVKWLAEKAPYTIAKNTLDMSKVNQKLAVFASQTFMSATLLFDGQINFFPRLLGIEDYRFKEFQSDIYRNQSLWVIEDGLDILNLSTKSYKNYITELIVDLVSLNRPILVLFTSHELLKKTYYALENKLTIPVFAQGITGSNAKILKRFRYADEAILLATSSFWEGVDFPEFDQSILLITRLPFESPEDPFVKRMVAVWEEQFRNVFREYTLPMATLRLKQAFGRNLRHSRQQSAIVVLDKRIITRSYGKTILKNLPADLAITCSKQKKIASEIKSFFNK
ncbi:MAG: 3'-5' exoribonuclease [Streptococcaceae bacterium]|jgi:ATP-dependent DNA helicase DinG|nr:3'-5' exoribonuclease [Streptococcaceae bacterium]